MTTTKGRRRFARVYRFIYEITGWSYHPWIGWRYQPEELTTEDCEEGGGRNVVFIDGRSAYAPDSMHGTDWLGEPCLAPYLRRRRERYIRRCGARAARSAGA